MSYTEAGLNIIKHHFGTLLKTPTDKRLLKIIAVEFASMTTQSDVVMFNIWRSEAAITLLQFYKDENKGKCWEDYLAILKVEAVLESLSDVAAFLELNALDL